MTASELLDVADGLYALAPGDFTPARDARARELKGSELAGQVKKLKKPSVAAWVVNQLVRHETEQVEQVLAMGEALRAAQAGLKGDELRALARQRRQLTAAVTTRARSVASGLGVKVTQAVADQVEATLTAAMVDEECARAVRSGLLVTALASTGVGDADVAGAVATPEALEFSASPAQPEASPEAPPDLHVVPDPEADQKARAQAEQALEKAEGRLAEASEALAAAGQDVSDLEARSMQLQAELDELRRKIAELESTFEEVDEELADAEEVRAEAESTVAAATKDRDMAAAALAKLR
jgi:hypothetical protein